MSFVAIRSEGGLLPEDVIRRILQGELGGQRPADFGFGSERQLAGDIASAWEAAKEYWQALQARLARLPAGQSTTTATREMWLIPLLEALGYRLTYQRAAAEAGGQSFPISHRAGDGEQAPPVHLEGFDIDLDRRDPVRGRHRSPHALVQDYLNRSEHLWGIVANGRRLRLVRQNPRISRPAYLEVDLEAMMCDGRFDEFAVFYRLCHRTRLPKGTDDAAECWLERYHQESILQGGRVRERLRDGVEAALRCLANGFLSHPDNHALREALRRGELTKQGFYQELLRLVYRILFLMVAEERNMIVPREPGFERRARLYARVFGVERLRALCEKPIERSRHGDLWLGLLDTFRLLYDGAGGESPLGIPPLNGDLFSPQAIPHLEGACLYNHDLLEAMRCLSLFREDKVLRRVNYAALDVEELGSVYESLLDFVPEIRFEGAQPVFDLVPGTERKSTGSYYTRPELVKELVESALVPVMEERLRQAGPDRARREQAILTMTVCDPACGSGHFLLEAARRLGRELAKVRSDGDEPMPEAFREAVRDVIEHCLYGVDVNPLAVDLCKLALWIEGHYAGRPLSFLDHRIRCGNSLIGVFSLDVLEQGIPDEAYAPLTGDDREVARKRKQHNRLERQTLQQRRGTAGKPLEQELAALAEAQIELASLPQRTAAQVRELAARFAAQRAEGTPWHRLWTAAHLWTAAFFAPKTRETVTKVPTSHDVVAYLRGEPVALEKVEYAHALASRHRFFHWPLEFPEVFAAGGFDVVLGNPPWKPIEFQEREFFLIRDDSVAAAPNTAERQRRIAELRARNPVLWEEFLEAKRDVDARRAFARNSGRFPLTGVGDVNTYALFAELGYQLLNSTGRLGFVLLAGIVTDYTHRKFFSHLAEQRNLVCVYHFENKEGIFPDVHRQFWFCLFTAGRNRVDRPRFAFFCTRAEHLLDDRRVFTLEPSDLLLVNPNTGTCPVFRTCADAELTAKIYRRVPVLVNERTGENPWAVRLKKGLFNMSSDSGLFLEAPGPGRIPLYESKMFHQFDHRWSTYENGTFRETRPEEKENPAFTVTPRYWVDKNAVLERITSDWRHEWFLVFRDVTNATNERTVIAAVIPAVGVGDTAHILFPLEAPRLIPALLANLNVLILDYVARQKIGGTHLGLFLVKQLPILPPQAYSDADLNFIVPRILELSFTTHDLGFFARDVGYEGPPFPWNEQRRAWLRAELDAYYALLYGLTRDELLYILDPQEVYGEDFPGETFRVLKENELRTYGEYRTKRLVLEAYDDLAPTVRRLRGRTA